MNKIGPVIAFTMITSAAAAADVVVLETAPMQIEAAPTDWSGFYIGAHAGWGRGKVAGSDDQTQNQTTSAPELTTSAPGSGRLSLGGPSGDIEDPDLDGWFGGGQVGYMWQSSNNWVGGLEADVSFASIKGDFEDVTTFSDENYTNSYGIKGSTKIDMVGTVRGRVGYAYDRFLPFVTGGLAWANVKTELTNVLTYSSENLSYNNSSSSSSSATHFGWTVGAGVEYAITDHWRTKVEYRYHDFGKSFSDAYKQDIKPTLHTVQVGLNYKF